MIASTSALSLFFRFCDVGIVTYHFFRPCRRLSFEFRAVSDLKRAGAPAWEEVGDLLPGQVLRFLELNQ